MLQDGNQTDRVDARKLSDLLYMNKLKPVYHGDHGLRTLKELVRSYLTKHWHDSVRLSRGNENAAAFSRSRFVVDHDFHVTIQRCEKLHEPFNRETLELIVQQG